MFVGRLRQKTSETGVGARAAGGEKAGRMHGARVHVGRGIGRGKEGVWARRLGECRLPSWH